MTTETILTDEQIEHGRHDTFSTNNPFCPCDSKTMRKAARWAEQAVLQSPEIRALRKDAAMLDWLDATNAPFLTGWISSVTSYGNVALHTVGQPVGRLSTIRSAIRAAMEQQHES